MNPRASIFQFGPFRFDRAQQELRRRDRRVRLSVSLLKLLTLFLTRHGELITREEIALVLWRDASTVDVATGINMAVRRLRAQLEDDPSSPTYIETVIGLGYRFIAEVEEIKADETPKGVEASVRPPPTEQPHPLHAPEPRTSTREAHEMLGVGATDSRRFRLSWSAVLVVAVTLLMLGVAKALWRRHSAELVQSREETPFFNQPPTQITFNSDEKISAEAVSPDGRWVAYSDNSGISVHSVDNGADRLLPSPASFLIERLAWYPNGGALLASGIDVASQRSLVWVVSLQAEPPRLLLNDAGLAVVSADGNHIAYTRLQGAEIWVADGNGQNAHLLVRGKEGEIFTYLLWSPYKDRLLYDRRALPVPSAAAPSTVGNAADRVESLYRWTYESVDTATGKLLAKEENVRFDSAFLLKDGRLFFPFKEPAGESKIMMVRTDLDSGRFLSHPRSIGPPQVWDVPEVDTAISFSASTSGNLVGVVLTRHTMDVYVGDIHLPGPTLTGAARLTDHSQRNYPHAWTPNGDAVVFDSANNGRSLICRQRLGDAKMEIQAQLPDKAAMAEFTPDGKWMILMEFTGWPTHAIGIFSIPGSGGKPAQLYTSGTIDEFHCPIASKGTCVLRETIANKEFIFFALDPVRGMEQQLGRTDWEPTVLGDWSISPDSSTVVMANHDPYHPSIQLVALSSNNATSRKATIPVPGFGVMLEPIWSPDGKGFFVESKTSSSYDLLYVDRDGHAKLLRKSPIPIWGVPSRDGRKLAFPGETISSNVWIGHTSLR